MAATVELAPGANAPPEHLVGPARGFARRDAVTIPTATARAPWSVRLLALAAALAAAMWSAGTDSLLLDVGARWHLDTARSALAGLSPGFSRLGATWPPVPHLLLLPGTAIGSWWHNGFAGVVMGGACFLYAATRVFRLLEELTGSRLGAWVAFLAFAGSLDLLYVQTTALPETVLIAFVVGATFHAARWMRSRRFQDLVWMAAMTCAATLSGFAGWAYFVVAIAVVAAWSGRNERRAGGGEANLVLFSAMGGFGIVVWLVYQSVVFRSPWHFTVADASAPMVRDAGARVVDTTGDVAASVLVTGWAVVQSCGLLLSVIGVVAGVVVVTTRSSIRPAAVAVCALLGAPVVGTVIALIAGETTVWVPAQAPFALGNVRVGLLALPFLAVSSGLLVARRRRLAPVLLGIVAVGIVAILAAGPAALADARRSAASPRVHDAELAADYLRAHHVTGRVLVDDRALAPLVFRSGLDMDQFAVPGSPSTGSVTWIVVSAGDDVAAAIHRHPQRARAFVPVAVHGSVTILRRISR